MLGICQCLLYLALPPSLPFFHSSFLPFCISCSFEENTRLLPVVIDSGEMEEGLFRTFQSVFVLASVVLSVKWDVIAKGQSALCWNSRHYSFSQLI